MEKFEKPARIAYGIGLAGMVSQQFFYGEFGHNFFPKWPGLTVAPFWVYLFTIVIIAACFFIIIDKKGRTVSLILGSLLLAMYLFGDFAYELIIDPNNRHLGSWADGLTFLALVGGAFVVAGSFPPDPQVQKSPVLKLLEKLIPLGDIFFCITMILYGYSHFLYTESISTLVPNWIPGHIFWTYVAGVLLIISGIAIVIRIKLKLAAMTLCIMIFIWLINIHIPMAIADPWGSHAFSVIRVFGALAFIGTAFLIASEPAKGTPRT